MDYHNLVIHFLFLLTAYILVINNMAKRTGISNKLRFEIFKRDSFKCQYCGRSAPDVILNVDHINPVAKGGKGNILNLITSCFECNSGKSDRVLSDNSVVSIQKKQLDDLNERRLQLDMLIQWKSILTDKSYEVDSIIKYFNDKNNASISLTDAGIRSLKSLLKKYSVSQILDAINEGYDKYFGKIDVVDMWYKLPKLLNFITASDNDRNKMKFFGGIKGRFEDTPGYTQWNIINTNRTIRELYKIIDSEEYNFTYSDLFRILNNNNSYRQFSEEIEDLYKTFNND